MAANNYAEIMLNNGDGSFSLNNTDGPFGARSNDIALGDMDGDGDLDIVTAGGFISNGVQPLSVVFTNDGNGIFTQSQSLGGNGSSVAIGDVNGDGDLDIALGSNTNSAGAFIYINDINDDGNVGVFTSTALADLDDDGDLDLIVGKANGGGITEIFQNDGAGNFTDNGLVLQTITGRQMVTVIWIWWFRVEMVFGCL